MKTVNSILSKAAKHWYLYLVWFMVVFLLWELVCRVLIQIPQEEKLVFFVGSQDCDTDGLKNKLEENIQEYLKQVDVYYYASENNYFGTLLQLYGTKADLFILPESKATEALPYYLELDIEKVKHSFGNVEFYQSEGKFLGIKIYDYESDTGKLKEYISYYNQEVVPKENYYLFFNKESLHLGSWNDCLTDGAVVLMEVMWKNEE